MSHVTSLSGNPEPFCRTLQLRAQWTIFTTPILTVIPLQDEVVGRLRGCILCVSEDGTLAVVAVEGLELSVEFLTSGKM